MEKTTPTRRYRILLKISQYTEIPLIILGIIWLILLIVELIWSLTPLLEKATWLYGLSLFLTS